MGTDALAVAILLTIVVVALLAAFGSAAQVYGVDSRDDAPTNLLHWR